MQTTTRVKVVAHTQTGKPTRRERPVRVEGRVRWARTRASVADANVAIYLKGTRFCLGNSTTDAKGEFRTELEGSEEYPSLEVYAIVQSAKGVALLSTADTSIRAC